ncbi:MAG: NAD-dependent epimerase/dehydratase family protein [Bacteroidota bacterium]|nr:NAD-dependent epimerase/dehydratase family protein [Bacteroidota bacterium]
MTNILVTGGAGFIASSLAYKLVSNTDNFVVIVDNLSTGNLKNLPSEKDNWRFFRCDVNNYREISEIMMMFKFDFVFHYAAVVGVKRTQKNPVSVLKDLHGVENILLLSKNTNVKRVFYSSSSEVYGEPVELPQNEQTTPLNSRLPYAIVKNAGEAFLRSYNKEFGLNYTIFRFFNTYGPKQSHHFVISKFINKALNDEPITIYGDGNQTRTFCYIDDNIDACLNAFYSNQEINKVINIGSDKEFTILELANKIVKSTNSKSEIIHLPPLPEGDMTRRLPDITRMKKLLIREPVSLDDGLLKTIPYFAKENKFI